MCVWLVYVVVVCEVMWVWNNSEARDRQHTHENRFGLAHRTCLSMRLTQSMCSTICNDYPDEQNHHREKGRMD